MNSHVFKNPRLIRHFLISAGVLLLLTGLAKIVSASGSSAALQKTDPVLAVSFRRLFFFTGLCESLVAYVCFFGKGVGLQA